MPAENSPSPASLLCSIEVPITVELSGEDAATEATEATEAAEPAADENEPPPDETELAADEVWQQLIRRAVHVAAQSQGYFRGQIGVLVTDDSTIHEINLRHLQHDYPTDVISFPYDRSDADGRVEGELVVSLCTALRWAGDVGWDWQTELLLYVVHGTLHLCGLEDSTPEQQQQMRGAEQAVLAQLGVSDASGLIRGFDSELRSDPGAVQP